MRAEPERVGLLAAMQAEPPDDEAVRYFQRLHGLPEIGLVGTNFMDALDLPPELQPMQNAYWQLRHEYLETERAYLRVMEDMLARTPTASPQPPLARDPEWPDLPQEC